MKDLYFDNFYLLCTHSHTEECLGQAMQPKYKSSSISVELIEMLNPLRSVARGENERAFYKHYY